MALPLPRSTSKERATALSQIPLSQVDSDLLSTSTDTDVDRTSRFQSSLDRSVRPATASHSRVSSATRRDHHGFIAVELVDTPVFQYFMGAVIALNTLAIAGETDHPDWPVWGILDNCFLMIFSCELGMRISRRGLAGFFERKKERWWNILDFVIVVLGVLDLWLLPPFLKIIRAEAHHHAIWGAGVLRFLRLLRLLRLLRVFKMVRRLALFLEAMKTMLGPFFLVLLVLFGFNLFVSIALTQLLGKTDAETKVEVREFFIDVQTSFFSLFSVITTDNWFRVAGPMIETSRMWCLFFVLFITFCSWTMISILTAVASDNVISATTGKQEKERLDRERKTKEFYRLLRAMFVAGDEDGNGLLDKTEFQQMLETDQLKELLTTLEIHVKKEELYEMWDTLDVAGTGVLTIDEFVDGLAYLQEDQIMTRHIANLDFGIRRLSCDLEKRFASLTAQVQSWRVQNQQLLEALRQEEQVNQQQNIALFLWLQWAVKKDPGAFPADLQDIAVKEAERSRILLESFKTL